MLDPLEVELVEEEELHIGDWVRVRGEVNHSSIRVVHRMEDGELWVAFCFMERTMVMQGMGNGKSLAIQSGDKVRNTEGLMTPL